jgi:hypothetical protein
VIARAKVSLLENKRRFMPVAIALAMLAGLVTSIVMNPYASADYNTGCGYGYGSTGSGFGYGTGNSFGYGYGLNGVFGYGYGNQVCPTTTTTVAPTTTTTAGGGGGGGGTTTTSTTTTTVAPTTTTTVAPTTTTTSAPTRIPRCNRIVGAVVTGRTRHIKIIGSGFYQQPRIRSTARGTRATVSHDNGTVLVVVVTVQPWVARGHYRFTVTNPNGRSCSINYTQVGNGRPVSVRGS